MSHARSKGEIKRWRAFAEKGEVWTCTRQIPDSSAKDSSYLHCFVAQILLTDNSRKLFIGS